MNAWVNDYCVWCVLLVPRQIFPVWCTYTPALTALLLIGCTWNLLQRTILGPVHGCLPLGNQYPMTEVQELGNLAVVPQGGASSLGHAILQGSLWGSAEARTSAEIALCSLIILPYLASQGSRVGFPREHLLNRSLAHSSFP